MTETCYIIDADADSGKTAIRFAAFDTLISISVYGEEQNVVQHFLIEAMRACERYERLFSRTLEGTDVWRINNAEGGKVFVDAQTAELTKLALGYCERSRGMFDITIGSVSKLWDMKRRIIPDHARIEAALSHVDWRKIEVGCDKTNNKHWIRLNDPESYIDLGGIAKGWIADRLGELFEAAQDSGIWGYCIDLGGNILVGGEKPDGTPWKIGLRIPGSRTASNESPKPYERAVILRRGSVVTSGIYERAFTQDGKAYHHILDPKTGYPVETDCLSASVVCERSIDAEGYSTTLLALGRDRGLEFARTIPEILEVIYQ